MPSISNDTFNSFLQMPFLTSKNTTRKRSSGCEHRNSGKHKEVEFSDTVVQPELYATWQKIRDRKMETYRKHHAADIDNVSWSADVILGQGTALNKIIDFLQQIQADLSVFTVAFSGAALGDCWLPTIADDLCSLVDEPTLTLSHEVVVHVRCGWDDDDSWLELLDDCVSRLSAMSKTLSSQQKGKNVAGTKRVPLASSESGAPVQRCHTPLAA